MSSMIGRTVHLNAGHQFDVTADIRQAVQWIVSDLTMNRMRRGAGYKERADRTMVKLNGMILAQAPDARLSCEDLMKVVKLLARWDMQDSRTKPGGYRVPVRSR